MKKFLSLTVTLCLLFTASINTFAYEFSGNSLFSLDIPEEYYCAEQSETSYTFLCNGEERLNVNIRKNSDKFCPAGMSKKDIEEYKKDFVLYDEEGLEELEITLDTQVLSCQKVKTDEGDTAIETLLKTTLTRGEHSETYFQKTYEFGGVENIYTFSYTALSQEGANAFDGVLSSVKINEAQTKSLGENLTTYAVAGVFALVLIWGIVRFLRTPEKRKQGKL